MKDLLWPLRIEQSFPGNWRMQLGAEFDLDGVLHVSVPGVLRKGPEIGYYVHEIGLKRTLEFRALVEKQRLWELPGLQHVGPEQPSLDITAGEYDGMHTSVMWEINALPPQVLPVMDAFSKLVDEAYASPREVLSGEADWDAPSFSTREPFKFEFTLRNKGSDAISVNNPMAPNGISKIKLLISEAARPEVPPTSPLWLQITPPMISLAGQPVTAGRQGRPIEPAPGQALRFVAEFSAYLSPAEYRAVLLLDNGDPREDFAILIHGILAIDLPPLRVVHR